MSVPFRYILHKLILCLCYKEHNIASSSLQALRTNWTQFIYVRILWKGSYVLCKQHKHSLFGIQLEYYKHHSYMSKHGATIV